MADVVEDIFSAGDKGWKTCDECKSASGTLTTLVGKYSVLKTHLEDVFKTKAVKVVFSPAEVHFTAATNTITLPHTTHTEDALDLVDAIIFESYNAKRKDQLNLSKSLSDVSYDIVASGKLTAETEAGTMTDYYQLAVAMEESDRTANMKRCIKRAKEATGTVVGHFLASPHETDEAKRNLLPLGDERRLPTAVMYVYQNIVTAGGVKIRSVILTKCGIPFEVGDVPGFQKRMVKDVVVKAATDPLKTVATNLDAMVKKNWPSATYAKRPGVLLAIIREVQTNAEFTTLRGSLSEAAFGFTADMTNMAALNCAGFTLKT